MADHNKPVLTSTYTNFVSELDARFDDIAVGLDPAVTTATNVPTGALRWNSALNKDQKWNGSAWVDKSATYVFNAVEVTSLLSSGNITLSSGNVVVPDASLFSFGVGTTNIQGSSSAQTIDIFINGTSKGTFSTTGLVVNGVSTQTNTTALTNSISNGLVLNHQTSGTPANGIGVGINFNQETASGNTETGLQLQAITTDVTAASEDFDFVVNLMTAGAAAAEKFRVTSVGNAKPSGLFDASAAADTATAASHYMVEVGTDGFIRPKTLANVQTEVVTTGSITAAGALAMQSIAKTAAYTVIASDRGDIFTCTNTWTLTLTAAATLGSGFTIVVVNTGVGVITVDPDASELIDGVATKNISAGQSCLLLCDGSSWRTLGLFVEGVTLSGNQTIGGIKTFTSSPVIPTPATATNNTQAATTAYTIARISNDAPTKTGGGASGNWGINITGSSGSTTGNAATVTTVTTTQVGLAYAGVGAGGVGTYVAGDGTTYNAASPAAFGATFTITGQAGTWRNMGPALTTGSQVRLALRTV